MKLEEQKSIPSSLLRYLLPHSSCRAGVCIQSSHHPHIWVGPITYIPKAHLGNCQDLGRRKSFIEHSPEILITDNSSEAPTKRDSMQTLAHNFGITASEGRARQHFTLCTKSMSCNVKLHSKHSDTLFWSRTSSLTNVE